MKNYILITNKSWHDSMFLNLQKNISGKWTRFRTKNDFIFENLYKLNPDWIFIPHWSDIIPAKIYNNYNCVVFHMTNLPYGRGGSPLQNLIERGHKETVISAIKVEEGIDTGDIYLKTPLSLEGTAEEIFMRSSKVIGTMIKEIIKTTPIPQKQEGEVVKFKRRNPEQSNITKLHILEEVYDYIRMLDCEGYPNAFIETDNFRFEFTKALHNIDKSIIADVRITQK